MQKKTWRILACILVAVVVIAALVLLGGDSQDFRKKYEGVDLSEDAEGFGRSDTYTNYLKLHEGVESGSEEIPVDVAAFEGDGTLENDENGNPQLLTRDGEKTTWKVNVPKDGMYTVRMEYLTVASRGVDIERAIYINDELPFNGADTLRFSRLWEDDKNEDGTSKLRKDNQGNDVRPSQVERFGQYQTAYCRDDMGYETAPYRFFFKAGENTITLEGVNEPVIIRTLTLVPAQEYLTYEEYVKAQPEVAMTEEGKGYLQTIEGESAPLRSSPSLYARYDRSSPATVPNDVAHTVLNYIGGDPWNQAGQWIQWDFEVPEDGWYNITIKARQMYSRGSISCRSIYIDEKIPFDKMTSIAFSYNTAWDMHTLADENGTPYRFFLEKGAHTIRMEATLGEMGAVLNEMEDSIFRLNQIYRKVLVLTGVSPDRFRDYNLAEVYPDVIKQMDKESKRLYKLVDDTVALTGQKNDRVAVAQTLAVQLEQFVKKNERITQSFSNFKDNITSFGTAQQNMAETKLDVDQIFIWGENAKLPKTNDNFFTRTFHELKAMVASYFVDYNNLGDVYEEGAEDMIEVWIVTGRDQSNVLKAMIDDSFTSKTGIKVNLKLVQADAILTAVVAGNGPDVVLTIDGWFAVNYAMRHAVEDLTQFEDFDEVVGRVKNADGTYDYTNANFYKSALDPLTYDDGSHKGIYALPETQLFSVLFYREDVLEELGLEVPQTWEDLIAILPTIQGNNMSVGIPFPDISNVDMSGFNALIYQNGGGIYNEKKTKTIIDSEAGVKAFKLYTSFYNDYGLPVVYDFVSRFRSGEMPVAVAQYSQYNTLAVSAPEIRGLWDFTLYPGTLQDDGTIDRSVHANGACCIMVATDDETVKKNAWEFMKWWTSADAQVRFGREMESVLGASARYATANRQALKQLAWSADQLKVLEEMQAWGVGFPEIAGGYSTTRHMTNAIRRVTNAKEDARETLLTYARTINEEIKVKRKEFNLPID